LKDIDSNTVDSDEMIPHEAQPVPVCILPIFSPFEIEPLEDV
jgi:hypothetical protein